MSTWSLTGVDKTAALAKRYAARVRVCLRSSGKAAPKSAAYDALAKVPRGMSARLKTVSSAGGPPGTRLEVQSSVQY